MDTILGRFRNLIVLAAILFAQIVGLAVQVKRPAQQGDTRLIRIWAVGTITPFEKGIVKTQNFFHDIWRNYVYLRGVRQENRDLKAQLDQMKLEQVRMKEDAEMGRRLQYLLAFKEQHLDETVAAQVIGTSGSDQSRVLYIDKGSNEGLKTDMAVITPNGIVGKVVQVFPDTAQVLPINDQMSGVGVALKNTRLQGILRGGASGTTTVQYIMADERVQPGEEVVTSGGDRIFPKGLPVGKVVDVKPGKDLFLNIRVTPSAQLDRLEEVLVVTKITEKPPDVQDLGPIRASDILAQRLPTVPDKPQVDANGNSVGTPATGAAAPGAGTTAVPNTAGTNAPAGNAAAAKPPAGTAASSAQRPATPGTQTNRAVTPGTTATRPPSASGGSGTAATGTTRTTPQSPQGSGVATPKPARKPPVDATQPPQTTPAGENPPQR